MIVLLGGGPEGETVEVGAKAVGLRDEATKRWWRPTGQKVIVEVWELGDELV